MRCVVVLFKAAKIEQKTQPTKVMFGFVKD